MAEKEEVLDTSDYKLSKSGRKVKAHRIIFNKGVDDGKKGITEMKKTYKDFVEQHTAELTEEQKNEIVAELQEVLGKNSEAGDWISDFVHSDNPKFAGKSKEKRKQMALAAYYAKQRNEGIEIEEVEMNEKLNELNASTVTSYQNKAFNKFMAGKNKHASGLDRAAKKQKGELGHVPTKQNEEAEIEEELKGNQHKLDKNKNGKLDKHDFKLLRKEDAEQIEEAIHADDYTATSEKSQFGGHRPHVVNKETGKTMHLSASSYKSPEHAKAHAKAYLSAYAKTGMHAADRAAQDYAKANKDKQVSRKEEVEHMEESVFDWKNKARQTSDSGKTKTYHDVKKTSTGTVYTKQFDKDGMSKGTGGDAAAKSEGQPKRGRGRPKKDKFAEAVEFLLALSEEKFDDMMEEGFDAFIESYEQLDELSKKTLGSYAKKAKTDIAHRSYDQGSDDEMGVNRSKRNDRKLGNRSKGVDKAVDRLTK
jgi:hypothetical protein